MLQIKSNQENCNYLSHTHAWMCVYFPGHTWIYVDTCPDKSTAMYMSTSTHIHTCSCMSMHIHAHSCTFMHVHACTCTFMHIHTPSYMSMHIEPHPCMSTSTCIACLHTSTLQLLIFHTFNTVCGIAIARSIYTSNLFLFLFLNLFKNKVLLFYCLVIFCSIVLFVWDLARKLLFYNLFIFFLTEFSSFKYILISNSIFLLFIFLHIVHRRVFYTPSVLYLISLWTWW